MARSKTYTSINKPIQELTDGEIKDWLTSKTFTEPLRSILIAELESIREGATRERRTLRGLWYSLVKPLLSRAGILYPEPSNGWDRTLSSVLVDLVRMGYTSYEEMKIVDGSRQRQEARRITYPVVNVQLVGDHFPWVILFSEKNTIWGEIKYLAELYGITAISGKGQPSFACTENTIRNIVRSESFRDNQPEAITLLSLTDYDPDGYSIQETQQTQIIDVVEGMAVGEGESITTVQSYRVGIEPGQLSEAERLQNAYHLKRSIKEKLGKEWYQETGGVDGQPLGLELDALPLSRLRAMLAAAIEDHIDLTKRQDDLRTAFLDILACELLIPEFEQRRRAMIQAVQGEAVGVAIQDLQLPEDLFREVAIRGDGWISLEDTKRLFNQFEGQAKKIMRELLS